MDLLEREMGYKEELFDFIQQFLRTVLLKRFSFFLRCKANDRRCLITLSLPRPPPISSLPIIPPIPTKHPPTPPPATPLHQLANPQRRRPRSRLRPQRLGLLGQNTRPARRL